MSKQSKLSPSKKTPAPPRTTYTLKAAGGSTFVTNTGATITVRY